MEEKTKIKKEKYCPNCKGENLSDGENDYIYSITEEREIPIQFCNDCHAEWFIEEATQNSAKGSGGDDGK